ncbi:pancreatic triacylglycerol lipase-like isoform X3 [Leptinotarsa decemlineata]|uniref:pancreatic triacylglycerol lipase-like isoform X3 n=1 Tax=Leptinotarsa decemlineata TaxID=7539 RepID=UPI003D3057B2
MEFVFFVTAFIFYTTKCTAVDQMSKTEESENTNENVDIFTTCYEELGCLRTDSKWYHKKYRPVNLRPVERHIIKTDFLLLKRSKQDPESLLYNSFIAKYGSIKAVGFNNESELMILIHDFTANGYTGWVKEKMHYGFENIHIVGHGIGAHIAGYVGTTHDKIKKITGLDPSGFRFEGMPESVKLNPNCAQYVEIIHTDAYESRSQGINETLGHSDFYVNSAKHQPGCSENTTFSNLVSVGRNSLHEGEILPGCDHKRSFKYFIESVANRNCTFMGIRCENDFAFENGKCASCTDPDNDCRIFGLRTYRTTIQKEKFFLNTADHAPYCMFQYRISIYMKKTGGFGYFDFILVDDNANIAEVILSSSSPESNYREMKGDQNNTFVYYAHPPQLGSIKEAKVRWNQKKKFYCIIYCSTTVNVEKIYVKLLNGHLKDEREESVLCSSSGTDIEDRTFKTFTSCSGSRTTTTETTETTETSTLPTTIKMSTKKAESISKTIPGHLD